MIKAGKGSRTTLQSPPIEEGNQMFRSVAVVLCFLSSTSVSGLAQVREAADPPRTRLFQSDGGERTLRLDYTDSKMSLVEKSDGPAIWTQPLGADDMGWSEFWVNDDGWVIRARDFDAVSAREPATGRIVFSCSILNEFPKEERQRFVHDVTDRPPLWEGDAIWAIRQVEGKPYFLVRAWWGRRIIIDLEGHAVANDRGSLHDAVVSSEKAWVLDVLRQAASGPARQGDPSTWTAEFFSIRKAAHLAGLLGVTDAVEPLKGIEKWGCWDSSGSALEGPAPTDTRIAPTSYRSNNIRKAAQLSLRRLGAKPTADAPVSFYHYRADRTESVEFPRPLAYGPDGADRLSLGMSGEEVAKHLGAPDAVTRIGPSWITGWEYDFEGDHPFTLRIEWDAGQVKKIERIGARWIDGTVRDEELVY